MSGISIWNSRFENGPRGRETGVTRRAISFARSLREACAAIDISRGGMRQFWRLAKRSESRLLAFSPAREQSARYRASNNS